VEGGINRLLGLVWSPKTKTLFASDVHGFKILEIDETGKVLKSLQGPTDHADDGTFYVADMQRDAFGNFHLLDRLTQLESVVSSKGKLLLKRKFPYGNLNFERAAIFGTRKYIACESTNYLIALDQKGDIFGRQKIKNPGITVAGDDGFMYVWSNGQILKIEMKQAAAPVSAPAAEPSAEKPAVKAPAAAPAAPVAK
jgi:hypothetical protein